MEAETVIALGFFDGVHIGHGALLQRAVQRARERRAVPAAFTFDRSPKEFVTGERVPLLTGVRERCGLIRELYGIERVIVAQFDRAMMTMPWEDFLRELAERHGAVWLVAGHDYRFGHRNEGTPERLRAWCEARGLGCDIIPRVELDGITVSSTRIREWIEAGELERAALFLGHPFALSGLVRHGQHLGTEELFPTVNLVPEPWRVLPPRGVYAARVVLPDGQRYAGVTNIGVRPTVSDAGQVTVETFLLDFRGDLYGRLIRVELLRFLRPERRFDSIGELHRQIERDIAAARAQPKSP